MATTFNDALQQYNIGTSSTTNINDGNISIPEGSETLSDLLKLNYDFKDTPLLPNDRSYNIYIWNNNDNGEIRFYTKDAKNNNNFNKNVFSGSYNEPRLNYNTKIGKDGKLYFWHNYSVLLPTKLSGWYSVVDDIYSLALTQQNADIIIGANTASILTINNNVGALAVRVLATEEGLVSIGTFVGTQATLTSDTRSMLYGVWDYLNLENNPIIQNQMSIYQNILGTYRINPSAFNSAEQLLRIQASSALSSYRINLANNFANGIGLAALGAGALAGILYVADEQQKKNYSTEILRVSDTLEKREISTVNNTINHTRITRLTGAGGFPLTNTEFLIPIQKNAVLIIGIDSEGIANILLVDQIGTSSFAVNENITINRALLNGSGGNLVLTIASLGTLKEWAELKTTFLQNKIIKIDTKNRRKANVIGYDDINPTHFTKTNISYNDNDGNISETIPYKFLEINANYKHPTCIQADSSTNANTAAVAVKLQTKRKIANVDFDGTANIDISYTDLTNKPTSFSGNIGIGTTSSASYNLDIYNQSTARIRIQSSSDFGATSSIEFRKGVVPDVWSDYRLINDNSTFKLQYENADFPYSNDNNIMTWNRIDVVNYIQTQFNANVGIGTIPSVIATYKLDVLGDIKATAFRGDGANITNLNENNLNLTTAKLYQNFNTTNFAIIDDKIDLPPNYSFNITDYDSQTLFSVGVERKYKGKMTANYDDRNGVYKLITTDNRTDNKAVLNYKVGDKISIRNTANTVNDYLSEGGFKYFNSLLLMKRPTNRPLNWAVSDAYSVLMYEWFSSDGLEGRPEARVRTPTNRYFPFTTVITFIIEAGFNYYLAKLYNTVEVSGGTLIVVSSGYGDDVNDFNRAFGAGQTFKLQITGATFADDYMPKDYMSADIGIASAQKLGGVKKGRGVAIDATTGAIDAVPVSSDLINSMNVDHFTNNLATGKIDFKTSLIPATPTSANLVGILNTTQFENNTGTNRVDIKNDWKPAGTILADKAVKLETSRNIAGVGFNGTGNIDIPYFNLINKLTAGSGISITAGSATTSPEISATAQTPTSASLVGILNTTQFVNNTGTSRVDISSTYVAPKATILETSRNIAGVGFDGSGAIAIPYDNLTFKPTAGTNITITAGSSTLSPIINATSQAPTSASLVGILNTTQFTNNTGTSRVDISSTYTAPKATILETSRNIAGVAFNGSGPIDIPYFNTTFKPTVGNGLAITTGSATASPNITLNLSALGDIAINTGVNPATIGVSYTSANLIGAFNTTDFVNTASKITLSNNTSNYVARVNTELTTALGTAISATQPKIISTAGQLIIGNGDGLTTTSTGLTWTSGTTTLNATNLTTANLAVSTQATITKLLTAGLDADMFILANNATNSLRFNQVYQALNDQKWILKQKSNNIDYNIFNFRGGKIAVGTQANPAYMLDVVGDINITGDFLKNANVYKPANAVLADSATTATKLATGRNIAGVLFDGTGDVVVDYFATTNKPIILQPTTTNLQLVSGYTFAVPGNVCIGSTAIATNVLQVGAGGRLRISNGTTDYTLLGTIDTDGATNTSIVISGTTRATNAGNIQYLATASGGSHIFYTASATTRMTISSSGVNINDNLGVSGRVGIGTAPHATYKLDVLGDINVSGAFRVGGVALANSWSAGTPSTNIYYNLGNVGIGTTNPVYKLHIKCNYSDVAGSLHLDAGDTTDPNKYALTIYPYVIAGGEVGYKFRTQNMTGGTNTPLTLNNYGNVVVQGNLNMGSATINGDTFITSSRLVLRGTNPTLYLRDTDNRSGMIHMNGNSMYFLNASGNDSETWTQQNGQDWAFRLDMNTNEARFGGHTVFATNVWNNSSENENRIYYAASGTTYIRGAGNSATISILFRSTTQFDMGYFNASVFCCYGPVNLSDRRIKRDIVEINDETALNMILQVQPTTYYYRDETRNRGNGKVYGFIAQQIKEVIPDAVHTTKEIIANIYKTCLVYNKREIYYSIPKDVAIDTEVHILDKEGGEKGKRCKIKEIYDDYFVIDEDIDGDDCFVFGYMVDDLNALDKSYIFTLNVCATQELHRRMEAQNVIIKSQDERIKELELKVERLLNYLTL